MSKKEKTIIAKEHDKEQYFYSKWWFWLIIIALIVINSCCLFIKDKTLLSNLLTIISGWISGIATIFIGVIATRQNKRYKQDTDEYNRKQEELIKQQYDFETFKHIMDARTTYIKNTKGQLQNFLIMFDNKKITSLLAEMETVKNSVRFEDSNYAQRIINFGDDLTPHYLDLKQNILNDWNRTSINDDLVKALDTYYTKLATKIKLLNYLKIPDEIKEMNESLSEILVDLYKEKQKYITELDVDLNQVLLQKTGDLNFIKKHYTYLKEKNNG